jgi:hypothetical protein
MLRVRAAAALVAAPLAFAAFVLPASADPLPETVVARAFEAIASAPPSTMDMRVPLTEAVRADRLPIVNVKKVETVTVEERVGNAMSLLSRMPTYDTDEPDEK